MCGTATPRYRAVQGRPNVKVEHARTGAILLTSQAAASLLNFIPSAVALLTLNDANVATMAVAITGYTLAVGVGRSLFGEAIVVLAEREGDEWAHSAATAIRLSLVGASIGLLLITVVGSEFIRGDLRGWVLTGAVSLAVMSHDTRRYELIARRLEQRVLARDVALILATVGALVLTWKRFDATTNHYLLAWSLVAIPSSADLLVTGAKANFAAARLTVLTGRSFGLDLLANRAGILFVAILARQAAGDASLADAEAQRLTMAVVNIAFLGAGPISLLGLSGRKSVRSDAVVVSTVLVGVAAMWWTTVTVFAAVGGDSIPAVFEPWRSGPQWAVLLWFAAAAVPFGFRYRLRTALASRTILVGASGEALGGALGVVLAVQAGWIDAAAHMFALYFSLGAIAWVVTGLNHTAIERHGPKLRGR